MKTDAVFAMFKTRPEVATAEQSLLSAGFSSNQILVMVPPIRGSQDFPYKQRTHILSGAEIGGALGALIAGAFGMLFGLEALPLPLFNSALPLNMWSGGAVGALFGLALGAAAGALVGIGTPSAAPDRFAGYVEQGGILLSVHDDDTVHLAKAAQVIESSGGQDITSMNEAEGWTSATSPRGSVTL